MLAAMLWTPASHCDHASHLGVGYNEVLCAFFVLAAFYSRLRWLESRSRKWLIGEWAAYLAGFGALEVIVMYPAAAALHALCMARQARVEHASVIHSAALFFLAHTYLIRKHHVADLRRGDRRPFAGDVWNDFSVGVHGISLSKGCDDRRASRIRAL